MRYLVNGVVIDCDFALTGAPSVSRAAPPDVLLTHAGSRTIPRDIPDGDVLQAVCTPNGPLYSTSRMPGGRVMLRLHGRVDFDISADARVVRAFTDPETGLELLALLSTGNLLATLLALRGETVLHASAVEVSGRAVAFVAHSGTGKSTLAALACGRGARFVTDDVLRFRMGAGQTVHCLPGATENRLRRDVAGLAPASGSVRTRLSVDGRRVWQPPASPDECLLAAIVLPQPLRGGHQLEPELVPAGQAVLELTRRPRILGWVDERIRAQTFRNLSRLAAAVPVYRALVPWGPPFDPIVIDKLLALTHVDTYAGA